MGEVNEADSDMAAIIKIVIERYDWDITHEPEFEDVKSLDDLINLALQGGVNLSPPVELK